MKAVWNGIHLRWHGNPPQAGFALRVPGKINGYTYILSAIFIKGINVSDFLFFVLPLIL